MKPFDVSCVTSKVDIAVGKLLTVDPFQPVTSELSPVAYSCSQNRPNTYGHQNETIIIGVAINNAIF